MLTLPPTPLPHPNSLLAGSDFQTVYGFIITWNAVNNAFSCKKCIIYGFFQFIKNSDRFIAGTMFVLCLIYKYYNNIYY